MKLEKFLEKFELFADAPNGVPSLRRLVLDLAVTGRLVHQDSQEAAASSVLEGARSERTRLVAGGKIKVRPTDAVGPDERPHQLPPTWEWARLAEVGHELGQKVPDAPFTYIDVGSIDSRVGRVSERVEELDHKEAPSRARKIVTLGTVIYSTVRPYLLNIAIIDRDFDPEPIASTAFGILHPFKGIDNRYLFYWLRSAPFTAYVQGGMKGMAYPAINDEKFYSGFIAVPPHAEQQRIVAKVNELMALCDRLEGQQQERASRRVTLAQASLARFADEPTPANLNFLFHDSYAIEPADIRRAILDLAVRGRLVPQDSNDEPAGSTLAIISGQKRKLSESGQLKADRKAWVKSATEPPHSIPTSWHWVRLQDVFEISRGGSPRPAGDPRYFGGSIPWITVGEITRDGGKYLTTTTAGLTEEGAARSRFISPGDLLLTNSGATLGVPKVSKIRGCMNDGVAVLRLFHPFALNDFAYVYLTQQTAAFREVNQGMGQPNLNTPIIAAWLFPFPPLAEQRRIVARVDQLMTVVDRLETQLTSSHVAAEKLTEACVAELTVRN